MRQSVSDAIGRLLRAGAVGESVYTLLHDDGHEEAKRSLMWLAEHLYVRLVHDHEDNSCWALDQRGRAMLQPCFRLQEPCRLFLCGSQVEAEMATFQLLGKLALAGWCGHVFYKPQKQHKKKKTPATEPLKKPAAFSPGGPLQWWVKPNSVSICKEYLLCLLWATKFKYPIEHFKPSPWYVWLLNGHDPKEYTKATRSCCKVRCHGGRE